MTKAAKPAPPTAGAPTSIGGSALFGAAVVLALLGGAGVWAATAKLASAIVATGYVTVDSNRKAVQHVEGGSVARILARDGDVVTEGQPIAILDDTNAKANFRILRAGADSLLAIEARLKAEQDGAEQIVFPPSLSGRAEEPEIAALMTGQISLFEARRTSTAGERDILAERVSQLDEEIRGLESQHQAKSRQIGFIEHELKGLKSLYQQGLAAITRVLALEREQARLEGERGELRASIARTKKNIGETKLQILQLERKFREQAVAELRETQTKLIDLTERLTAAETSLKRIVIRAPVAGVVVNSTIHNTDAVINPGQVVAEIVPEKDELVIEARVQPADADNLIIGQEADVRILAFNQRTTPPLKGRFAYISADRITDQRTGEPHYLARVHVGEDDLKALGDKRLIPGMPAEVIIKTGSRTAMDYILEPITSSINRAWREE
ncbi:MAG: HlyD family type I secretion periplasmic adaptor subunit [Hyphomicrobiales bacterium]|nr:HlyD family type I secretion periplasmic adaptor subunit [Hyphomicrobiales bacterium]